MKPLLPLPRDHQQYIRAVAPLTGLWFLLLMLPLLADYLLPRSSGKLVITNFSTTALVDEVTARHGGTVIRVPVGRQAATDALAMYRPEEIAVVRAFRQNHRGSGSAFSSERVSVMPS